MASLTVHRPTISYLLNEYGKDQSTGQRNFRVVGQGSKSVETATNHRGYLSQSPQRDLNDSTTSCSGSLSQITMNFQCPNSSFRTDLNAATLTSEIPSPRKGFFIKRKDRSSSPDSLAEISLNSPSKKFEMKAMAVPTDGQSGLFTQPSKMTVRSQENSRKILIKITKPVEAVQESNKLELSRTAVLRSSNVLSKPPTCKRLDLSLRNIRISQSTSPSRTEELSSTTRTNLSPELGKELSTNSPVRLSELLMGGRWENQRFDIGFIQQLKSAEQSQQNSKSIIPCIRTTKKIAKSASPRFKISAQKSYSGLYKKYPHIPSKHVSFSDNVLVYTY